jgi:hypothetical protein
MKLRIGLGAVVAAAAAANGLALAVTTSSRLSAEKLQTSLNTAFSHLYLRQQAQLGRGGLHSADLSADATCHRLSSSSPTAGAGDDWSCVEQWVGPYGVLQVAQYDVKLRTNGCFTATGPPAVVGRPIMTDTSGRAVLNPVYEFDGCIT